MSKIDFDNVYVAAHCDSTDRPKPIGFAFDSDPYLVPVSIEFYLENDVGDIKLDIFGEKERAKKIAILDGVLILGNQISRDRGSVFLACDDYSGDLDAAVSEIDKELLLEADDGNYRNILYIDSMEMSASLIEAENVQHFYDLLPQVVFEWYHLMPELICYLVADAERYYATATEKARLDPRSVDGFSPLIYTENGYSLSDSGNLLYSITEYCKLPI